MNLPNMPSCMEILRGRRTTLLKESDWTLMPDSPLSDDEWNKVDATAEWFSKKEDDGTSLYNFWEATNGVGSITIEN